MGHHLHCLSPILLCIAKAGHFTKTVALHVTFSAVSRSTIRSFIDEPTSSHSAIVFCIGYERAGGVDQWMDFVCPRFVQPLGLRVLLF
jgi:hypothetical protein